MGRREEGIWERELGRRNGRCDLEEVRDEGREREVKKELGRRKGTGREEGTGKKRRKREESGEGREKG